MTDTAWLDESVSATSIEDVQYSLAGAYSDATAIFPIGGETSLDFGLPPKQSGIGLSLGGLDKVIDFPARDLTITVEAGITMHALNHALAKENLCLPIDVPQPAKATLGGVVATNWNGPRRFGQGTVRDYVIGISAVDGRGRPFKGGGRVVKNVAGYDFCKLLTGSLGTLGVITQVTLRLKPIPQRSALMVARVKSTADAEQALAALVQSATSPVAIELLAGSAWQDDANVGPVLAGSDNGSESLTLVVGLEGSENEVKWMLDTLGKEWQSLNLDRVATILDEDAQALWDRLAEFPQAGEPALSLKASMLPSHVSQFIRVARSVDAGVSIQSHAGNGIVILHFADFPGEGLSRTLIQKLAPAAAKGQGNVIVLSNPGGSEMTHQSVWGGTNALLKLMGEVKRQFDPKNILNPDRFVYL